MKRSRLALLVLWLLCDATLALAAPSSEETQRCVAASTQGQTDRDEGRLISAREQLLSCAREDCPAIVKKSCAEWLSELAARIPSVTVRVQEAGQDITDPRVTLDGQPVTLDGRPLLLDPGPHTLSVAAREGPPVTRAFLVAEREQGRLVIVELPARSAVAPIESPSREDTPPKPEPAPMKAAPASFSVPTAGWVLGGVGVVGVATFTVLRIEAASELRELERTCSPGCSARQRDDGKRKALIADVSLGIGIAALAGAAAWTLGSWLAQPDDAATEPRAVGFSLVPTRGGAYATLAARLP